MNQKLEAITLKTVVQFLLFNREATLKVAASSQARWLGLMFVLLAAIAREYDGEYLPAEPWHLLLPLAASLIGCLVLFLLVRLMAWCRQVRKLSLFTHFGVLLNLYWMTAPLALLYATPFERWMGPGNATRANLAVLAVISVWRVALMVRSISVLHNAGTFSALTTVMCLCLGLGGVALKLIPSPVFMIMGGIRLTESEDIILGTRFLIILVGVLSAPVWLIGYIACLEAKSPWRWQMSEKPQSNLPVALSAWTFVVVLLTSFIPLLLWSQPEQRKRFQAEQLLRNGLYEQLCEFSREHVASEFPPHWDPPPRVGYAEREPDLAATLIQLKRFQASTWFWDMYLEKIRRKQPNFEFALQNVDNQELAVVIELFSEFKDSLGRSDRIRFEIDRQLAVAGISQERAELLTRLRELVPKE